MGKGAYMNVGNNRPQAIQTFIPGQSVKCMKDSGDSGSNLSRFNQATIKPDTILPGGDGQYIEAEASFPDCLGASTFTLRIEDDNSMIIGEADFVEENEKYSLGKNSNPGLISVAIDNSGSQARITVMVTGADTMTRINRWVLMNGDRTADIWYNQDYTAYGLNPVSGPQSPSDANIVTVMDLGNGTVALRCGEGYNAFASVRDDWHWQVQFQAPNSAEWCTQVGCNETLQAIPTGDGFFALYSPHFSRYVTISPSGNPEAQNCNPLIASASDIGSAARFTAVGVDHASVFDFVQIGKNATGMSFAGVSLAGADLRGTNLARCDFTKATSISSGKMNGANLQDAKFTGMQLGGLQISAADCTAADFTGCDFTTFTPGTPPPLLAQANLTGAVVPGGVSWSGAKMAGAVLKKASLSGADLSKSDLTGADFSGATLTRCNLRNANLSGAHLAGLDLTTTALAGANLSGADLTGAKLAGVDLTGTDLAGTNFTGTDLSTVRFPSPLTRSTDPKNPTIFAGCTLPYAVIGLDWSWLDLTFATITGLPADLPGLVATGARRPRGDFSATTLDQANFTGATLDDAIFTGASLQSVTFAEARLTGAVFTDAVLDQAIFVASALGGVQKSQAANFSDAFISNCDFTQANLYGVLFAGATLVEDNKLQTGTNLQETDFSNAYLPNADFSGANLQGAKFDGAFMVECVLTNADLSAQEGAVPASLVAACLQAADFSGTNLAGSNLTDAAITCSSGQIMQQYYDEDGTLTPMFPINYPDSSLPAAASFSNLTTCPNGSTYEANLQGGKSIEAMMQSPKAPKQWKPRNIQRGTAG